MKKLFAKSKEPRSARISLKHYGGDTILIYRMTNEKASSREAHFGDGRVYSLSVTKISCKGEKREFVSLYDIARSDKEAQKIFELVSRGLVTPAFAAEIVSDIIGIYL